MGALLLLGIPTLVIFAFFLSPEDDNMKDAVRLLYIHVPMAIFAYVAVIMTGIGSVFYLWKKCELDPASFPHPHGKKEDCDP